LFSVASGGHKHPAEAWDPMFEEFNLEIASEVNSIAPAVDKIVAQIRESQCLPGKEPDVEMALFEALANAVIHGNHEEKSKSVRISCRQEPGDRVHIVVRDQGAGFDPAAVPDPTRPENLEAEHGRGILMMKAFMDEVHFEKGGTEVHLVKKCDRAAVKKAAS
jgi:serine/threonine-protein kinase RsbW